MRSQPLIVAVLAFLAIALFGQAVMGQSRSSVRKFQGEWDWAIYPTSRKELPPAYRTEPLKSVPVAGIWLKLKQRGSKLTGEYSGSAHYLARLEDGELDTSIKGNTATLELESGFGGKVTVLLKLEGNRLHWKTIKAEGESYFPNDVFLRRVRRRGRHAVTPTDVNEF